MSDWQSRLVEVMDAKGISGGELARRTGFTPQYINSLRSKERGARLTLDTAKRLAQGLQISVEWLTAGNGARERSSDGYPAYVEPPPDSTAFSERYPTRSEVVALLASRVEPEVIAALRAVMPPEPGVDPGRAFWIDYAHNLAEDLKRIKSDPLLGGRIAPPASSSRPRSSGRAAPPNGSRPRPGDAGTRK